MYTSSHCLSLLAILATARALHVAWRKVNAARAWRRAGVGEAQTLRQSSPSLSNRPGSTQVLLKCVLTRCPSVASRL